MHLRANVFSPHARKSRDEGDAGEREHERHDGQVAAVAGEQQAADRADADEQERDRQRLPAPPQREQPEADQPDASTT